MLNLKIDIRPEKEIFEIGGVLIYKSEGSASVNKSMIIMEHPALLTKDTACQYRLLNLTSGMLASYSFDSLEDMQETFTDGFLISKTDNRKKLIKYIPPSKITIANEE